MARGDVLCARALAAARLGRFPEAEAAYREVLGAAPAHFNALLGLGLVLRRQRRPAEAEAVFRAAIAARRSWPATRTPRWPILPCAISCTSRRLAGA